VKLDPTVKLDLRVKVDLRVKLDLRVQPDIAESKAHQAHQARLVQLDHKVIMVNRGLQERLVRMDITVLKVLQEARVLQESREPLEHWV